MLGILDSRRIVSEVEIPPYFPARCIRSPGSSSISGEVHRRLKSPLETRRNTPGFGQSPRYSAEYIGGSEFPAISGRVYRRVTILHNSREVCRRVGISHESRQDASEVQNPPRLTAECIGRREFNLISGRTYQRLRILFGFRQTVSAVGEPRFPDECIGVWAPSSISDGIYQRLVILLKLRQNVSQVGRSP